MSKKISSDEVFSHVERYHSEPEDFRNGDLEERIYSSSLYELRDIEVKFLDDQWRICEELAYEYSEEKTDFPPVVLLDYGNNVYDIVDGSHRIFAARLRKDKTIKAYVS